MRNTSVLEPQTESDAGTKSRRDNREVAVNYPRDGEIIISSTYTFQIGAVPEAVKVEILIDKGEWRPCRESLGLWWYDWHDYAVGDHQLRCRIVKGKGEVVVSPVRRFSVRNESSNE